MLVLWVTWGLDQVQISLEYGQNILEEEPPSWMVVYMNPIYNTVWCWRSTSPRRTDLLMPWSSLIMGTICLLRIKCKYCLSMGSDMGSDIGSTKLYSLFAVHLILTIRWFDGFPSWGFSLAWSNFSVLLSWPVLYIWFLMFFPQLLSMDNSLPDCY